MPMFVQPQYVVFVGQYGMGLWMFLWTVHFLRIYELSFIDIIECIITQSVRTLYLVVELDSSVSLSCSYQKYFS